MSSDISLRPIPYQSKKIESLIDRIEPATIQRALLASSIVCAIISLIPGLGFGGSLALRSIAFVTASMQCAGAWKKEGIKGLALQVMRLALVALGLSGVAFKLHFLVVASVATDIAFNLLGALKSYYQKDPVRGLSHFSIVLIDTFILTGLLTGAWPYLTAAAAISGATMFAFAFFAAAKGINKKDPNAVFDVVCYIALGAIGIASAVRPAEITTRHYTKYTFYMSNRYDDCKMYIYDVHGHKLGVLGPGESSAYTLDPKDCSNGELIYTYSDSNYVYYSSYDTGEYYTVDWQSAMPATDFPTLPVGGPSLALETPSLDAFEEEKPDLTLANTEQDLQAWLKPCQLPWQSCALVNKSRVSIGFKYKTGERYDLDLEHLSEQSAFIKRMPKPELSCDLKDIEIESDENTFNLLIEYLTQGHIKAANKLSEQQLLELYYQAEYFQIKRLEDLCIREIARRLADFSWKNTNALKDIQNSGRSLAKLVDLYEF